MKTLIELYDERPIENVLASEVFRPERTVFLCPQDIIRNKQLVAKLKEYYIYRGLDTELVFLESSMYNADKLLKQLQNVVRKYPDCVVDITGGTDAALFACGRLTETDDTPAFTYSRKRGCFFDIHKAPFADNVRCSLAHTVEDCFRMAGGNMRTGRVDNGILKNYIGTFDGFFGTYFSARSEWNSFVGYIQTVSAQSKNAKLSLDVSAPYTVKNERGRKTDCNEKILLRLADLGYIKKLRIDRGQLVSFSFADSRIRTWLRDVGSVLELYVYKAALDSGRFNDVVTSAVVDWEGVGGKDAVTNEIDVMAMAGIVPVFISCKTCAVTTEAINELAVLRDRFGGYGAKAIIVTSQYCRSITRHRAFELGIIVLDLNDLKTGDLSEKLADTIDGGMNRY